MRKFLLASVAVTALMAGPAIANAQTVPKSQDTPAAGSQQQSQKGSARDDIDSKRGSSAQSGERRDATGSQSSPMTDRASKGGQSGEDKSAGSSQPDNKGASKSQGAQNDDHGKAGQKSGRSDQNRQTTGASEGSHDQGGAKAQKSGKSDMNKGANSASQAGQDKQLNEQKPGQSKASSSSQPNQRSTTGQSPNDQQTKGDRANRDNATGTSGGMNDRNANQRDQAGSQRDQGGRNSTSSSASTSGSAAAKPEVQSKFTEVIEKQRVKPVTNVNFSVSVGSTVPGSVHFYDVPRDIVTIYPEYRGKKFIVVRDEIVIIEPGTKKVVAVMPRSGRTTTGTSTSGTSTSVRQSTSSKLQLAPEKRRVIRETVIKEQAAPRCTDLQVSIGAEVPRSLQLRHLPDMVVSEVPEIRSYDFCLSGDDVVLIDPSDYRIVEVID